MAFSQLTHGRLEKLVPDVSVEEKHQLQMEKQDAAEAVELASTKWKLNRQKTNAWAVAMALLLEPCTGLPEDSSSRKVLAPMSSFS